MDRVMVEEGDFLDPERKYGLGTFVPQEDVESGWPAFALLDRALRQLAQELGWPGVARWELRWARYDQALDGWVVRLQVWPPQDWLEYMGLR